MSWTVEDHLRDQPERSVELYHRLVALLDALGPYSVSVAKTAITFKGTRRGFAGARPDKRGLTGYFDLQRAVTDARVTRVSPYTAKLFVHHYRITEAGQLDDVFAGWLAEAYAVGNGAHVGNASR